MAADASQVVVLPCSPPTGPDWIHEIKHDGFRILAGRDKDGVRLFTSNGYNFTGRFPKIAAAIESLRGVSCVVDGEAIVVNAEGLSVFDLIRYRHHDHAAVLCASARTCVGRGWFQVAKAFFSNPVCSGPRLSSGLQEKAASDLNFGDVAHRRRYIRLIVIARSIDVQ